MKYLVIFLGTWGWMWRVVWVTQCRWQLTSVSSSVPLESRSYWMRTAHMKKGGSHVNAGWVDMVLGKVSRKNDIVHWGFLPLFCNLKKWKISYFFQPSLIFFWVKMKLSQSKSKSESKVQFQSPSQESKSWVQV